MIVMQRHDLSQDFDLVACGVSPVLVPAPHIHIAVYRGEVIALDRRTDRFFGLGPAASKAVLWALSPGLSSKPGDADMMLNQLVARGLLTDGMRGSAHLSPLEPQVAGGLTSRAWRPDRSTWLTGQGADHQLRATILAARNIQRTDTLLRGKGMSALLDEVEAQSGRRMRHERMREPGRAHPLRNLVNAHLNARMIYPRRIDCLAGSAALAIDAWRHEIPVRFLIGVQKYPFYAHAWVEIDGSVVNDIQAVHDRLSIMVAIPAVREVARS